jgi:glyoxylase-like metal-dependent hydrolase (beta-lactamase superfamily II)
LIIVFLSKGTLLLQRPLAVTKLIMELESIEQTLSNSFSVANGVWGRKDAFVNYYIIKDETTGQFALVDAGLKWSVSAIKKMAKEAIGENGRPSAIILTHGHFDHVGALKALAEEWNVPIYAHALELPYLTGKSSYPPADPTVGGGAMASMSFLYPAGPIDVSEYVEKLPDDNTIPGFPEWKYMHTPGHSPGHISLYREKDKVLIAGDAFVTTKAESAIYALSGMQNLSGPPKYFTPNWAAAKMSVLKLAALDPEVVATGHGKPMRGEEMRLELNNLSRHFDKLAVPAYGRYVNEPAVMNENGVVSVPAPVENVPMVIKTVAVALGLLTIGFIAYQQIKRVRESESSFELSEALQLQD